MIIINMKIKNKYTILSLLALTLFVSCARMGNPDGGWFDETPPKVIGASPADKGVDVKSRNVKINFDEYVKIDNATENVIVSPPQLTSPEIKAAGKSIDVKKYVLYEDKDYSNKVTSNVYRTSLKLEKVVDGVIKYIFNGAGSIVKD